MRYNIKSRLAFLDKTSRWLIDELKARGVKIDPSDMSKAMRGKKSTPAFDRALETADTILREQERAHKIKEA